jgi:hypothetical protein
MRAATMDIMPYIAIMRTDENISEEEAALMLRDVLKRPVPAFT